MREGIRSVRGNKGQWRLIVEATPSKYSLAIIDELTTIGSETNIATKWQHEGRQRKTLKICTMYRRCKEALCWVRPCEDWKREAENSEKC